jgi:glutaredoxin
MMTLYSTGCPKCNVLKKKLEAKNVQFNLESDPVKVTEKANELGILSVPFLVLDDNRVLTFEQAVKEI